MRHTLYNKRKISKKIKIKRGRKSRQKYSRYRRLQKGGLNPETNSGELLGITHTWQFNNQELVSQFQDYIFCSETCKNLWLELLQVCKTKKIPVYVITSGNLIGVIRTIQLLGLSDLFKEVISIRANMDTNPNPIINPDRYFGGVKNKNVVIEKIMEEEIPKYREIKENKEKYTRQLPLAAFFDDDAGNFEDIDDKLVKTSYDGGITDVLYEELRVCLQKNIFFTNYFKGGHKSRYTRRNGFHEIEYNFTSVLALKRAITGISGIPKDGAVPRDSDSDVYKRMVLQEIEEYNKIKILFLDWDKTVSIWQGPPDFKGADYIRIKDYLLPPP